MNLFEKIINKLKSLFRKKQENIGISNLTENEESIISTEINNNSKEKNELEKLFKKNNIGDIIWAKRYRTEEEKQTIPKGHQEGPFLVIGKCEKGLICAVGKSTIPKEEHMEKYYPIASKGYLLTKETYFRNFDFAIIDNKRYRYKIDTLTNNDLENVMLNVKRNNNIYYKDGNEKYKIDLFIQPSDIINYKEKIYIILDITEDKILCIPYNYKIKNIKIENIDKLDYSNITHLDINIEYKYLRTMKKNMFIHLLNNQKKYLEKLKNLKKPQRGSIFTLDNEIYYIYGEISQEWQTYKLDQNNNDTYDEITISERKFYTNYENINISKKEQIECIYLATEEEIETIKNNKKIYKITEKHKLKQQAKAQKQKIEIGDIIEHKKNKQDRFIIINKYNNQYYCISINKLIKGKIETLVLHQKDIIISKDKSIKGIIWLENHKDFNLEYINSKLNIIINTQEEYLKEKPLTKKLINNN